VKIVVSNAIILVVQNKMFHRLEQTDSRHRGCLFLYRR